MIQVGYIGLVLLLLALGADQPGLVLAGTSPPPPSPSRRGWPMGNCWSARWRSGAVRPDAACPNSFCRWRRSPRSDVRISSSLPGNREAVAFIDAWPDWPAPAAALYGPSGSGKSHLVSIWAQRADARIVDVARSGRRDPAAQAAQSRSRMSMPCWSLTARSMRCSRSSNAARRCC